MGPALNGTAPFGFSKVVFLSHVLTASTPVFPGDPAVDLEPAATIERRRLLPAAGRVRRAVGHALGGASALQRRRDQTADQLEPADFFLPAVVLDHRADAAADPDYEVTVSDLERWEAGHGAVPAESAVLLMTGFDLRWADHARYLGTDESGRLHYPGFNGQAARWLVERRQIAALGTDTMGVDPGADETFAANRALLRGRRLHLENLCGLGSAAAGRRVDRGRRPANLRRLRFPGNGLRSHSVTSTPSGLSRIAG